MTTTALYRNGATRTPTLGARLWTVFSAFLMKIADANIRARSVEPFGL